MFVHFNIHWILLVHLWHPLNYVCTSLASIEFCCTSLSSVALCLYIFGIRWILLVHFDIHWIMLVHLWHPLNYVCTSLASVEFSLYTLTSIELCLYTLTSIELCLYTLTSLNYVCTFLAYIELCLYTLTSVELCLYIFGIHWIMFIHLWHPLNSPCRLWHSLNYACTSLSSIELCLHTLSSIELCLYIFDIHWIIFVYTFVFWYPMNFVSASLDPVQYGILLVHYGIYYSMVSNTDFLKSKCWPVCLMVFGISLVCTCYLRYDKPNVIGGEKRRATRGTGIESIV